MKTYRQTFSGIGAVPLDMLRYDSCWPSTQDDVLALGHCWGKPIGCDEHAEHQVTFTSHHPFTLARS
jgi:hypothetical protein